ncbi:MAG: DUF1579 family protein [Chthonomonas sp.]|nr:DUF1579 family protein [Chthonomonas sp.]
MASRLLLSVPIIVAAVGLGAFAQSQNGPPDPVALMNAQREAMKSLDKMQGTWRGDAWAILPDGSKKEMTQTERSGPMLDGTVRVVEGRGYTKEGKVEFNALAVISYSPATKKFMMKSFANGQTGEFEVRPTDTGFTWEIPAGPMIIRYTATITKDSWHEIGERIMPGKDPIRIVELNLKKIGDTNWPAEGFVKQK